MKYADLVALVGPEAADVMVMAYGGARIPTPESTTRDKRIMEIRTAFLKGATPQQVMERFGIEKSCAYDHQAIALRKN